MSESPASASSPSAPAARTTATRRSALPASTVRSSPEWNETAQPS